MKVLLLNQAFYPDQVATAQFTLDLALFLTEQGCAVTVVAGRRAYDNPHEVYSAHENYRGIEIYRLHSTGYGKRTFVHRMFDALTFDLSLTWRLLCLDKQDVVISFTSPPLIGLFGTLFCLLRGGRSIQWLMDINPDAAFTTHYLKRGSWIGKLLTACFRFTLKHSQHIIVLDRWMKAKITAHGTTEEKVAIVPPWNRFKLESAALAITAQDIAFRKQHGIEGKFVVLFAGNHSIVHPMDTLLKAAARLRDEREILFVFMGGGVRVADVSAVVKQHELANVVQLARQPFEIAQRWLSAANLHAVIVGEAIAGLVHPSKLYGVLATGKPYLYLGPKQSCVGDILAACPYGFQAEHGDVQAIVDIIHKVKGFAPDTLKQFAQGNTEFVRKNFTAEKILNDFYAGVLRASEGRDDADRRAHPTTKAR